MTNGMRPILAMMIAAGVLTGCASGNWHDSAIGDRRAAGEVAPGTSGGPSVAWIAPPAAVPPPPPPPGGVATVDAATPMTLERAIDIALTNNPNTRAAWLNARAAEASLGSARSLLYPEVDATVSLSRQDSGQTAASTTFGPSLALSYLLFDFGGRASEIEQARQSLIAADYSHNQALQDVVFQVAQSWYGVLETKALLAAQEATINERHTSLDAANARHNAGVATIADVLQAQTAFSQAQLSYETFQGNLRTFEGTLATVLGLPPTTPLTLGELPSELPLDQVTSTVDILISQAAADRPQLAAARANAERLRIRVQQARAAGLPTIGISSSVGQSWASGAGLRNSTPYAAGIALRVPLFTGFRTAYDVRAAEATAQAAAEDARGVEQQVALQVWSSYYALQTAAQRVKTSRDLLASAQQSATVATERYRSGVGSILDSLTAESALESARAQEVQARTDWLLALAQLAHDTGARK
ncbi:MAG: outer rane efflux protein [Acidobacteria bacterium]|nr:outer rane efflux protein [Acidobacteriota bacterium]